MVTYFVSSILKFTRTPTKIWNQKTALKTKHLLYMTKTRRTDVCWLSCIIPGNSRPPPRRRSIFLTSIMTPQMLITIPHAAIFGPQNRSDGMSVFGLINRSETDILLLIHGTEKCSIDSRSASVSWSLSTRWDSASLGNCRRLEAKRPIKTSNATRPAFSSETGQWRLTSKLAQHSYYPVDLLLSDIYNIFSWICNL